MSKPPTIEEIEARRSARKAKLQEQADAQRVIDLEALDAAEMCHGDTNVCYVDVAYTPGQPTMAIARKPKPVELKRYREGLNIVPGEKLDLTAGNSAAALLGSVVVVYPPKDVDGTNKVFADMCEARPDLAATLGQRAVKLAQARAAEEGKG
jgi:hypothetical protein